MMNDFIRFLIILKIIRLIIVSLDSGLSLRGPVILTPDFNKILSLRAKIWSKDGVSSAEK